MLVLLWIAGGLLALVVLAMVLLPMFIDEQALLEMAQEQVKTNTGGELIVEGETELSFFPRFGLRLGSVLPSFKWTRAANFSKCMLCCPALCGTALKFRFERIPSRYSFFEVHQQRDLVELRSKQP